MHHLVRKTSPLPKVASVIDLNRLLDRAAPTRSTIHGVPVRDDDNEHISLYGGMLLRPDILPTLVQLGLAHQRLREAPAAAPTTTRSTPASGGQASASP